MFLYFCTVGAKHANETTGEIYRFHFGRGSASTFHTKSQVVWLAVLGGGALTFFVIGSALGWPFSDEAYEKARATYGREGSGD
jgi:hypothetical protein